MFFALLGGGLLFLALLLYFTGDIEFQRAVSKRWGYCSCRCCLWVLTAAAAGLTVLSIQLPAVHGRCSVSAAVCIRCVFLRTGCCTAGLQVGKVVKRLLKTGALRQLAGILGAMVFVRYGALWSRWADFGGGRGCCAGGVAGPTGAGWAVLSVQC